MLFIPRFKVGLLFDHFLKILFSFLPEKTRDGSNVAKKICELVGSAPYILWPVVDNKKAVGSRTELNRCTTTEIHWNIPDVCNSRLPNCSRNEEHPC